jgi:antitoxin component of MazEF toxin-antitoxin module
MQARLTRWGSSLGLPIPKSLAERFRLTEGMRVTLEPDGDRIVISMPPSDSLATLLEGMTPDAMHEGFDWGADQGRGRVD